MFCSSRDRLSFYAEIRIIFGTVQCILGTMQCLMGGIGEGEITMTTSPEKLTHYNQSWAVGNTSATKGGNGGGDIVVNMYYRYICFDYYI